MGPDTGATTCLSGTTTKYDNCKPCPNKGTLTSCPSPYTCTYEACSNRYYKSGCKSGYDWNKNTKTCTSQCPDSYRYDCDAIGYEPVDKWDSCNGLYKKCKCSAGYSLKSFYVGADWGVGDNKVCSACPKHVYSCTGYGTKIAGTACTEYGETLYDKCECDRSLKLEWDEKKGICVCPSSYKYTCDYTHKHSTKYYTERVSYPDHNNSCYDGYERLYSECRAAACYKKISNDEYVYNPNGTYCSNSFPCFPTEDEFIEYFFFHTVICSDPDDWGGGGRD